MHHIVLKLGPGVFLQQTSKHIFGQKVLSLLPGIHWQYFFLSFRKASQVEPTEAAVGSTDVDLWGMITFCITWGARPRFFFYFLMCSLLKFPKNGISSKVLFVDVLDISFR